MKYLKVLVICFLSYFFDCYGANEGTPSLSDMIPQSPSLTPVRSSSIGSAVFADESAAAAESPNLSRKEPFSSRKTQRRGSVVPPLQHINSAVESCINTSRPSATAFNFPPNLNRPSSGSIGVRRSAGAPASAATTPRGDLLSTPMGKHTAHKYSSPPDDTGKVNPRSRLSIDYGEFKRSEDAEDSQENSSDNQRKKAKADSAQAGQNTDSETQNNTKIEDNKLNKSIFFIVTALVVSFSILYKTNKKFYNKVNYYWEKIKSKIKFLYNKDLDPKPKSDQSKEVKILTSNSGSL